MSVVVGVGRPLSNIRAGGLCRMIETAGVHLWRRPTVRNVSSMVQEREERKKKKKKKKRKPMLENEQRERRNACWPIVEWKLEECEVTSFLEGIRS